MLDIPGNVAPSAQLGLLGAALCDNVCRVCWFPIQPIEVPAPTVGSLYCRYTLGTVALELWVVSGPRRMKLPTQLSAFYLPNEQKKIHQEIW